MIRARLRHSFRGFRLDVDFRSEGPVLAVFGRSGSGKTSLLHALAGLLRPASAEIALGEELVDRRPGGAFVPPERRRMALVPQDPLLFPHRSTRGNLAYAPRAAAELETPRGRQILEVLRLEPLLDRRPATLSGGERQRVALGRALLSRPRLLLLDEPASSLDAELAREVMALLLETKRELSVPMVFVTHRPAEVLALADDCLILEDGRVVAQGTPLEVLSRPREMGVARLVGVDNLLRLPALRHEPETGVSMFDLGEGLQLAAPLCDAAPGQPVDLGIYAEDVILCRERPPATSARNALPASIESLDPIGHEVLVGLRLGGARLRVRITPGSARSLELALGTRVHALIKTTACHLLSAAGDRSR